MFVVFLRIVGIIGGSIIMCLQQPFTQLLLGWSSPLRSRETTRSPLYRCLFYYYQCRLYKKGVESGSRLAKDKNKQKKSSKHLFLNISSMLRRRERWERCNGGVGGEVNKKRWKEQAPIIYFYAAFNLHFLFAADKGGQGTQGRWHPESSPGQRAAVNLSEAEYWLE